jgi:integrase
VKTKLTKTLVEKLTPKDRPYEVYDTDIQGLLIRVQPLGQKNWYLRYRIATGRKRIQLGAFPGLSPEGARTVAKMRLGEVAGGVDVQARKQQERSEAARQKVACLGVFIDDRYGPWCLANLKSGEEQVARLKADFSDWWKTPMADLTAARIDAWRTAERGRGVSARTVNRNFSRLRSACAKAVEWGVLPAIPFASIKPLKYDKTLRVRYLTAEQERTLYNALEAREARMREERARYNQWRHARHLEALEQYPEPFADYLRPLVLVVRNTGLRRSEALGLQWCNVDLVHRVVTVTGRRAKSSQTRRVPLNATAVGTLEGWREVRDPKSDAEYVFGREVDGQQLRICTAWRGVRKEAGLGNLRFHDLRHNFASKLVQKGTDLNTVRELLGHASIDMTLAYAHLSPEGLAAAVERIA